MACRIDHFLGSTSWLGKILLKTNELAKLNIIFKSVLDVNLAKHCVLAAITEEKVTVIIDSSSWATKFHYAIPDLLKNLKAQPEFKKIKTIHYQIARNNADIGFADKSFAKDKNKNQMLILSQESSALLLETADRVKNSKLQRGLRKLASRVLGGRQES